MKLSFDTFFSPAAMICRILVASPPLPSCLKAARWRDEMDRLDGAVLAKLADCPPKGALEAFARRVGSLSILFVFVAGVIRSLDLKLIRSERLDSLDDMVVWR